MLWILLGKGIKFTTFPQSTPVIFTWTIIVTFLFSISRHQTSKWIRLGYLKFFIIKLVQRDRKSFPTSDFIATAQAGIKPKDRQLLLLYSLISLVCFVSSFSLAVLFIRTCFCAFLSFFFFFFFFFFFLCVCVCLINSLYSCLLPYFHVCTLYCSFLILLRSCCFFFSFCFCCCVCLCLCVLLVVLYVRTSNSFFLRFFGFFCSCFVSILSFLSLVTIVTKSFLKENIYLSLSHIFIS